MRTKHLLTAMVLPALFAACTNDDFQSAAPEAPVNAEGRNLVENVTLEMGTGADSRLVWDGDYTWEAGDRIGACLMDVITSDYNATSFPDNLWHNRFDLVNYIQTNYKFTRDDAGMWTTEAKMLEGNYFFCYPYDANRGKRDAYTFSVAKQELDGTTDADLMKAYADNNSFVGYGKVEQGAVEGETVKVDMLNVFGQTGITIENGSGQETYTIERIVLRGSEVENTATVNPTTCTPSLQYNSVTPAVAAEFNVAQYTQDVDEMYDATLNPTGLYNSKWSGYKANDALRDVLDYTAVGSRPIEVVIDGGAKIGPRETARVLAMVAPTTLTQYSASNTSTQNIAVLDIYTDKGIIRGIQLNRWYTVNDNTVNDPNDASNILTDKRLSGLGNGEGIKVTFDITSLDRPAEMDVYNNADLANLIHWNAGTVKEITADLQNSNVQLTKAMYDELVNSSITKLTIKGASYNFTINKDVADGALNGKMAYNVKEVRVNGTQSLASNIGSKIRIQSGATVNVTKNVTLKKGIDNLGTLNVNGKISGTSTISNGADMTVASGKEIVAGVTVKNDFNNLSGTITNAGTIRNLNNTILLAYNTCGYVINTGIIGTEAQVAQLASEPSKNAGMIQNNNGRVFLSENTYHVYDNGTSTTRINDNENGNIIVTNLDVNQGNFLTANNKLGNIVQEITAPTNTDALDGRANTLWLSSVLNVEKTDKDGNYVEVDLTSPSLNAPALMNGDMNVVALTADAEIAGKAFQSFRMGSITINPKAKLRLNNIRMTITGANNVTMLGFANNVATFTINSNAALLVEGNANTEIKVQHPQSTNASHNVLDNNSNSTKISPQ